NLGVAYVFSRKTMDQQEILTPPSGDSTLYFGKALSVDDNRLAIRSLKERASDGVKTGAAYFFHKIAGRWKHQYTFVSDGAAEFLSSGSVVLDGDLALVGMPSGAPAGAVNVLEFSSGKWNVKTTLTGAGEGSRFGESVALSGETALIGDPSGKGRAHVYRRSKGGWVREATLTPPQSRRSLTGSGEAVAIGNGHALVSGTRVEGGTTEYLVDLFVRSSNDEWNRAVTIIGAGQSSDTQFGHSMALDQGRALIGAPKEDLVFESESNGDGQRIINNGAAYLHHLES
ncbi:MAG: hypothetical protein ABEI52_05210, partial [Halobacteriaceae archaeon]